MWNRQNKTYKVCAAAAGPHPHPVTVNITGCRCGFGCHSSYLRAREAEMASCDTSALTQSGRGPRARERMRPGDETDTDSNAYLVIELQFVKVSQDGRISRIVHVPLPDILGVLTAPKPKSYLITCNSFLWVAISIVRARTYYTIRKCVSMNCVHVPDLGSEIAIVDWCITS